MTIPATSRVSPIYQGNASATAFAFSYKTYAKQELQVIVSDGITPQTLVLDSDYSVSLNADQVNTPGGSVTYPISGSPLAVGRTLVVVSAVPNQQDLSLPTGGAFNAASVELGFDRQEVQLQQFNDTLNRTIRVPVGESISAPLPAALTRANYILGFDGLGNPVAVVPTNGSAASLATDLTSTSQFTKGAGQVGFSAALSYPVGTVGEQLGATGRVVTTIAALKALSKTGVGRAFVLGYYAAGDGGGGQYYYDAADTVSTDNGGTIIVASDAGRWKLSGQQWVSICQFGADKAGVLDSTAAVAAALAAVNYVAAPPGTFKMSALTLVAAGKSLVGAGPGATTFVISNDNIVFRATGQSVTLASFAVTKSGAHTSNGIEIGDAAAANARLCTIRDVTVTGMGNDGIRIRQGNIGHLSNVNCVSNGRDGVHFGIETANTNGYTMDGFNSLQSNVRDGLNFEQGSSQNDPNASRSHPFINVVCQTNGRYGVYCGTPGNVMNLYVEASVTTDIYLDTYAYGNLVLPSQQAGITDVGAGTSGNMIQTQNAGAAKNREWFSKVQFAGGTGKGMRLSNSDGTAGVLDLEKTGSVTYAFKAQTSGQNQTLQFLNTSGGFYLNLQGGIVYPIIDNTLTLGTASFRWSQLYAGTATINTSDEREKQDIRDLNEKELAVARRLKPRAWRWRDAVAEKGDAARIHVGWIAQEVIAAFTAEGLDAFAYGVCCHDTWEESTVDHPAELGEDGTVIRSAWTETIPAGDRYGVRNDHIQAFILAALL